MSETDRADPFDLARFVEAQAPVYDTALAEIRGGRKRTHWMWFIFPQFQGLGTSAMSERYSIRSLDEARAYLAHPLLGARLQECAGAVVSLDGRTAFQIFGAPDDMKLRSSATLFGSVSAPDSIFERLLAKYYGGRGDPQTLELVRHR